MFNHWTERYLAGFLAVADRYVTVQEKLYELSTSRVASANASEKHSMHMREREAETAEKVASQPVRISGDLKGDIKNEVTQVDSARSPR